MRFTVRQILLLTALAAIFLFLWVNPYLFVESPGHRYQRGRELQDLRQALMKQIRNGDSYARVTSILGPGYRYSQSETNDYIELVERVGMASEGFLREFNFKEGDEIVRYRSNRQLSFLLVFRNRRLVNHDPDRYVPE